MLRNQIFNMKRGSDSVSDYVQKIKGIIVSLCVIGIRVFDSDIVMHVLNGLEREFDNFVISVQNRDVDLSFNKLKSRILIMSSGLKIYSLRPPWLLIISHILHSSPKILSPILPTIPPQSHLHSM